MKFLDKSKLFKWFTTAPNTPLKRELIANEDNKLKTVLRAGIADDSMAEKLAQVCNCRVEDLQ